MCCPTSFLSSKGMGENKMYGFCIKYGDLEEQCSKDEKWPRGKKIMAIPCAQEWFPKLHRKTSRKKESAQAWCLRWAEVKVCEWKAVLWALLNAGAVFEYRLPLPSCQKLFPTRFQLPDWNTANCKSCSASYVRAFPLWEGLKHYFLLVQSAVGQI